MKTVIRQLRPGQAFRIELGGRYKPLDYRVVYVNACRAYVEPLRKRSEMDILEDSPGGRVNISPDCECDIIDEELEMMMKSTPSTSTTARTATVNKMIGQKKKRDHEPRKQERPIREGTVRARLLAALNSGNTAVPKLMKELAMSRSLLLSHIHELWRCHGYGYSVTDDAVKLIKPVGGAMKVSSTPPAKKAKTNAKTKVTKKKLVEPDPLADEDEDPLA